MRCQVNLAVNRCSAFKLPQEAAPRSRRRVSAIPTRFLLSVAINQVLFLQRVLGWSGREMAMAIVLVYTWILMVLL